jgi:hypothetical protein
MYNLNEEDPVADVVVDNIEYLTLADLVVRPVHNIIVCNACGLAQQCPPPSNSVKIRFCLAEWPARKCDACCSCHTCKVYVSARRYEFMMLRRYELMMQEAVDRYMELPVGFFNMYSSMDLE